MIYNWKKKYLKIVLFACFTFNSEASSYNFRIPTYSLKKVIELKEHESIIVKTKFNLCLRDHERIKSLEPLQRTIKDYSKLHECFFLVTDILPGSSPLKNELFKLSFQFSRIENTYRRNLMNGFSDE